MHKVRFVTSLGVAVTIEWGEFTGRMVWSDGKKTDFMERDEIAQQIRILRRCNDVTRGMIYRSK